MNKLPLLVRKGPGGGNGSPVAPYSPRMPLRLSAEGVGKGKGKMVPRQHSRNEPLASLPPSLGARLIRNGRTFRLELERNEQTLAHSIPSSWSSGSAPRASKLMRGTEDGRGRVLSRSK